MFRCECAARSSLCASDAASYAHYDIGRASSWIVCVLLRGMKQRPLGARQRCRLFLGVVMSMGGLLFNIRSTRGPIHYTVTAHHRAVFQHQCQRHHMNMVLGVRLLSMCIPTVSNVLSLSPAASAASSIDAEASASLCCRYMRGVGAFLCAFFLAGVWCCVCVYVHVVCGLVEQCAACLSACAVLLPERGCGGCTAFFGLLWLCSCTMYGFYLVLAISYSALYVHVSFCIIRGHATRCV